MKKGIKIASFLLTVMLVFAFTSPGKQINKLVSKVWKGQEVSMEKITLPDSFKMEIVELNKVYSNKELVGYACFTTAKGCRIGGCAAPESTNSESYETFDYIVIYDTDFSILKVEVANYSGQYGYEICRAKWLTQFMGKTFGFKLDENIDGISGATISATYLIDDLNNIGKTLQSLRSSEVI